jgi:hypothetical protein
MLEPKATAPHLDSTVVSTGRRNTLETVTGQERCRKVKLRLRRPTSALADTELAGSIIAEAPECASIEVAPLIYCDESIATAGQGHLLTNLSSIE